MGCRLDMGCGFVMMDFESYWAANDVVGLVVSTWWTSRLGQLCVLGNVAEFLIPLLSYQNWNGSKLQCAASKTCYNSYTAASSKNVRLITRTTCKIHNTL
ncbi:hypothetical protein Droror1_Dr00027785 [Drosera rotundifolia]